MGLSIAANRFTESTPNTSSVGSANIQSYGPNSKETAASTYTQTPTFISTIPAISYKLLGSSPSTGKSPLELLLSNPIQFVKASMMSPVYKRNLTEAYGSPIPVSKSKRGKVKKPHSELPKMTLIAPSCDAGVGHLKECEKHQAKDAFPIKEQEATSTNRRTNLSVDNTTSSARKKRKSTEAVVPLSTKRQPDEAAPGPTKLLAQKVPKVLVKVDSTTPANKKRKADIAVDEVNPPTRKPRTSLNGSLPSEKPEPSSSSRLLSVRSSTSKLDALQAGMRVKGFHNRVNDCYRNAVLQLFCSSSIFRHEIGQHDDERCKLTVCVCCTLKALFENHHVPKGKLSRHTTNNVIAQIIKMARVLPNQFKTTKQEDATEYLHAVLHTAKDQLNEGLKGDALKNNPIDKTFGGSFPSVLTCPKCHHKSYNHVDHPSLMLHPSVMPYQNKSSHLIYLTDVIGDHFKPEKVDATCEKCKHNKKKFTKQIEIEKLPEFLILNIMRWTGAAVKTGRVGASKLMNRLRYEEKLKLKEGGKEVEYVLHAVVAHSGKALAHGHYIAFVKQPDGTWAECNDTHVEQTSWATVSKADGLQANILGYQRVH